MLLNQIFSTQQTRIRDVEKRRILAISFMYYPLVILNIILTVMLLNVGEKLYLSLFWVFFVINKIKICFLANKNTSVEACAFCMFDFFQIGCFTIYKNMNFTLQQGDVYLITMLHYFILPWTFAQSILIFGQGVLDHDNQLESAIQVLVYISFILLVLVGGLGMSLISSMKNTSYLKIVIMIFSSYTIQCALFSIHDNNGTKIGFYLFVLPILTLLVQYYYLPKVFSFSKILIMFLCSIFMIPFQWDSNNYIAYNRSIYISYYFNQLVRTIVLIIVGSFQITVILNEQSTQSLNNQLIVTNFILASIFGIISLLIQIKDIQNCLFRQKVIVISSQNGLKESQKILSRENLLLNKLEIYYLYGSNNLMRDTCTNPDDCQKYSEILLCVSLLLQKQIEIKSYQCPQMCKQHFTQLLMQIESFCPNTLKALKTHINIYGIQNTLAFNILFERYFHGFGTNQNKISNCLQNIISPDKLNKLKVIEVQILQILTYQRNIRNLMIVNPQLVLYDLIQDLDFKQIKTPRKY